MLVTRRSGENEAVECGLRPVDASDHAVGLEPRRGRRVGRPSGPLGVAQRDEGLQIGRDRPALDEPEPFVELERETVPWVVERAQAVQAPAELDEDPAERPNTRVRSNRRFSRSRRGPGRSADQ